MATFDEFKKSLRLLQDLFIENSKNSTETKLKIKNVQRDYTKEEHEADETNAEHSSFFSVVTELGLQNTVICMAIAHSRGILHAKTLFTGKTGHEVQIDSLDKQASYIEKYINLYTWLFNNELKRAVRVVYQTTKEEKTLPPKLVKVPSEVELGIQEVVKV